MSRNTTAYANAAHRERVHELTMQSGESLTLTVDFTSVLNGSTVASTAWYINNPQTANMSLPAKTTKTASAVLLAQYAGIAVIRCTATLANGLKVVQMFVVRVEMSAYFSGDTFTAGPYSLSA